MQKSGTIVGKRYCCRHLLAEGGMAEVYLAERLDTAELVALKRLHPHLAINPIFADMFAYEASLSSSFSHKNIVRCEEFFREEQDFFMVLEYVLGKEVGALTLQTKNWNVVERVKVAAAIGLGVIDALSYLHHQEDQFGSVRSVVHGDISPQNIMVNVHGEIKIYDFGAALAGMTSTGFLEKVVRGNPRYMSPEQMAGANIGPASDIFSLCLILLEIIFSDIRFERSDKNLVETFRQALTSMELPDALRPALDQICVRGLSFEPEDRFGNCDEMRLCLEDIARHVNLFDRHHYLCQIIKAEGPALSKKPLRRQSRFSLSNFLYLSFATMFLSLSIWTMITVFSDIFEPKHQHNLPVWPSLPLEAHAPIEMQAPKSMNVNVPVVVPKKKERSVGKHGTLVVKVKPWAEVFVDGQFFGSTPMGGLNLPEGQYLVQLRNPDVSTVALRMVKIYADKKTELVHNF